MPKNTMVYRLLGLLLGALLLSSCSGTLALRRPSLTPSTDRPLNVSTTSTTATPTDPVQQAIAAVIQKANNEQVQAFTQKNPSPMQDTATASYYAELTRINRAMASSGVTGIELITLEWGPIAVKSPTTATAETFETWRTTFDDGTTTQDRERNVYSLVLQNGSWKIQTDDHPDSGVGQPGSTTPPPATTPGTSPGLPPFIVPAQAGQSHNWSGYYVNNGSFTAVSGTWTVPQPTNSGTFASGSTWVGIGGVRMRDLIQAGTEETVGRNGQISYDAWYELLPRGSQQVTLTVAPGDSVSVALAQQTSGNWQISFKNNTTGKSYQTTVTYQSSLSSAEWIEEAPSIRGRRLIPLEEFGTVQIQNASTTKDGKSVTISEAAGKPITMIDAAGATISTPSKLDSVGSSFSISRTGPAPQVQPVRPLRGRTPL